MSLLFASIPLQIITSCIFTPWNALHNDMFVECHSFEYNGASIQSGTLEFKFLDFLLLALYPRYHLPWIINAPMKGHFLH